LNKQNVGSPSADMYAAVRLVAVCRTCSPHCLVCSERAIRQLYKV